MSTKGKKLNFLGDLLDKKFSRFKICHHIKKFYINNQQYMPWYKERESWNKSHIPWDKLKRNNKKVIHCIGDSHASFFSGYDEIQLEWPKKSPQKYSFLKSYRLGAVIAYNLCKCNTTFKGQEKLFHLLNYHIPRHSKILLCFGWIDCAVHINKQAIIQNKSTQEITREIVDRYISVIKEIKRKGFQVMVWNVNPSALEESNPNFPHYGTCIERNNLTKYFNKYLKQKLIKENVLFLEIFDKLITEEGMTKGEYLIDPGHLSQKAMPFCFDELRKCFPEMQIDKYITE